MGRINQLTQEQKANLLKWRDRWWEIGTCTNPTDREKGSFSLVEMYRVVGRDVPVFVWCGSPLSCILAKVLLKDSLGASFRDSLWASLRTSFQDSFQDSLGDSLRDSLWAPLGASLWASLGASLGDSLRDSLWASLGDSLRDSLRDSLWAPLGASLRTSLGDSLWASLGASLGDSFGASLRTSLGASLWASLGASFRDSLWASLGDLLHWGITNSYWICFYLFCQYIGVRYCLETTQKLQMHERLACSIFWILPYERVCFVSDRPSEIHWDRPFGMLHHDGGPAVKFRDGWSVWALHGVRVPQWLAEMMDVEIDPRRIAECQNAEVRREFVRKVGLDRIYHALGGRQIDSREVVLASPYDSSWCCCYRLMELQYVEGVLRRVLEMPNPSLPGVLHVEYVPAECETVEQAMNFRLSREEKDVDDENGSSWWLQGDVVIVPQEAKLFKRWPERIA